jgi:hypothetical protein
MITVLEARLTKENEALHQENLRPHEKNRSVSAPGVWGE